MKSFFRLINIYWISLFILLGIFTFFVPPFEKPDEPVHFFRAMSIYFDQWKPIGNSNKYSYQAALPTSISSFPESMRVSEILMRPDIKFPIKQYRQIGSNNLKFSFSMVTFRNRIHYIPSGNSCESSIR
jgi:hypothetical protein